jgi:hypothetical protein
VSQKKAQSQQKSQQIHGFSPLSVMFSEGGFRL